MEQLADVPRHHGIRRRGRQGLAEGQPVQLLQSAEQYVQAHQRAAQDESFLLEWSESVIPLAWIPAKRWWR